MNNKHPVLVFVFLGLLSFLSSFVLALLKLTRAVNYSWLVVISPPLCLIGIEILFCIGVMMFVVTKTIYNNRREKYITMNVYD